MSSSSARSSTGYRHRRPYLIRGERPKPVVLDTALRTEDLVPAGAVTGLRQMAKVVRLGQLLGRRSRWGNHETPSSSHEPKGGGEVPISHDRHPGWAVRRTSGGCGITQIFAGATWAETSRLAGRP